MSKVRQGKKSSLIWLERLPKRTDTFQSAQKQKDKTKGAREALEETERLLKSAKKKEIKSQSDGKIIKIKK